MTTTATVTDLPRPTILTTGVVLSAVFWVAIVAVFVWGSTIVSHYRELGELRRDILCERGLTLLASADAAAVARGDTIVREEHCRVTLDAAGNVPVSTAKLDAFLTANPDGLDELMALRDHSGFAGPWYAHPMQWFTWGLSLFAAFLTNAYLLTLGIARRHREELRRWKPSTGHGTRPV